MAAFFPLLGSASFVYLLMSPRVNKMMYRPMMFFPVDFPEQIGEVPSLLDIKGKEVFFTGTMGQDLHGWYWKNPNSEAKKTILFSHGNSGNLTIRLEIIKHLLNTNCSVFIYDYQGFGKSTGKPSVEGICDDARSAYDYLVEALDCERKEIVLYGESLGAAVSTYLSSVRECSGMVLQSGFASLKRIAREHFPPLALYPEVLFPKPALDSLSILKEPHPPVLFIHGEQDTVVPVQHSIDMHDATVGRKAFLRLPLGSHSNVWSQGNSQCSEALAEFLELIR